MNQPFRTHVLVCTQEKPDKAPACTATGGKAVLEALKSFATNSAV
jgi:hypothetical protein